MELIFAMLLAVIAGLLLWPACMAALAANREVDRYVDQELREYQVETLVKVYKGALVGMSATGYVRGLVAGDKFVGLAYESADNSAGAAGAKKVRVFTLGDFKHALANAAITDIGRRVYASDDQTLTFAGSGNTFVGWVQNFESSGVIILRIAPTPEQPALGLIANKTANYTVTHLDNGKTFTNLGAGGAVVFSLPAAPPAGLVFHFVATAAQEIRIDPGAADAIFVSGAKQADGKYVSFDDEAEHLSLISNADGDWIVFNSAGTITVEL